MQYKKREITTGAWLNKSVLAEGMRAKLVSETKPILSNFKDKDGNPQFQDVAKILIEGTAESVNTNLNRATLEGLIDAFGDDSVNWQGKVLTIETEKMRIAGKAVIAMYLIPEGYKRIDDENGYASIVKQDTVNNTGVEYPEDHNLSDVPF